MDAKVLTNPILKESMIKFGEKLSESYRHEENKGGVNSERFFYFSKMDFRSFCWWGSCFICRNKKL